MRILSFFLLFLLVSTVAFASYDVLKVVTYNVNYGAFHPDNIAAIDSLQADIVCLQETNEKWRLLLMPNLGHKYPHADFRNVGAAGGYAILSKYPIHRKTYLPATEGWFEAGYYLVETPHGMVQLLNVHLKPTLNEKGKIGFLGSAYFKSLKIHRKEVAEFYKSTQQDLPLIAVGDFNENDKGKGTRWLKQQGMTDALALFDKKSHTWHWPTRLWELKGRYDRVLFDHRFTCENARVLHAGYSDHYPVLAQLRWVDPTP